MKAQSTRLLPTLLAGSAVTVLTVAPVFAQPTSAPMTPAAVSAPAAAKGQADPKPAPRIEMLMTDTKTAARPQGHKANISRSRYASWLPNPADAIRRQ